MSDQLTVKQQKICDLIALGLTSKEIAQNVGIRPRTVEGHRDIIYRKMGVRNAVQLVRKMLGVSQ